MSVDMRTDVCVDVCVDCVLMCVLTCRRDRFDDLVVQTASVNNSDVESAALQGRVATECESKQ